MVAAVSAGADASLAGAGGLSSGNITFSMKSHRYC